MAASVAEIPIEDLSTCCRVCLEEPHRSQMLDMNLIYDEVSQLTYYDCYEICTNDNLRECEEYEPYTICKHCSVELQWAYVFYQKVIMANQKLKDMRNTLSTEAKYVGHETQEDMVKIMDTDILEDDDEESVRQLDEQLETMEETMIEVEPPKKLKDQHEILESSEVVSSDCVNEIVPRQRHMGKFYCQYCNKQFRNHSHMVKHQLIHLSDRPRFQCSACDRVYLTKQALKVHVDTIHNKSGSVCKVCGKVFAIAKGLEIHMRYHYRNFPFECNQCDSKFAQRSHLNIHQQVQHSSARFLCEFPNCGKLFTSSSALRNHECTHTEMPLECNVCQRGFPARSKLRLHAQRKHNMQLTLEQLETMRKFHIMRVKRVLATIDTEQLETKATNDVVI